MRSKLFKCAPAIAAFAALPVFADPPGDFGGSEVQLYISGATAQDELLLSFVRINDDTTASLPELCVPGSLDVYDGTVNGVSQRAYFCTTSDAVTFNSNTVIPSGSEIVIYKEAGGSSQGAQPVANNTTRAFISMTAVAAGASGINTTACTANGGAPITIAASGDLSSYRKYEGCNTANNNQVPTIGISDIEPALLGQSAAVVSRLTANSVASLVWGVPVSKAFRDALQVKQGLTQGAEDEANMPSLSKAIVSSAYAGENGFTSWNSLLVDNAGAAPSAWTGITAPSNYDIYVCRRGTGSGTQRSFQLYFLNSGCTTGAATFVPSSPSSNSGTLWVDTTHGTQRVFSGTGAEDVLACMNYQQSQNRWAIGVLGTETSYGDPTGGAGNGSLREHRFIKVDGVAPTLLNTSAGRYPYYSEQSINVPNAVSANNIANQPDDEEGLVGYLLANLGNPSVVSSVNEAFQQGTPTGASPNLHPFGDAGYLALNTGGFNPTYPMTATNVRNNPVAAFSKQVGALANCKSPILHRQAPIN